MAAIRRFLLRVVSLFRAGRAGADLAREITAHLQLLEDTFLARGLTPDEARFAARRAFGGVEQAKEHQRDARSFRWLDGWWLDARLGVRMLIKYPGLTLVGGLGMAVTIAIAVGAFSFVQMLLDPALPLDEGDRLVAIQNWDAAANARERRLLHDFVTWRDELRSVQDAGAFRTIARNLIAPGGYPETVCVAEMTASGFRVAREDARAELTTIGQRTAAAFPKTHAQLRPQVMRYARTFSDMDEPENALTLRIMQAVLILLLVLVAVNVAILVYARTVTRQAEIAVRSALGAGRGRIVGQLFVEALVLTAVAAAAGLALTAFGLEQVDGAIAPMVTQLPFWVTFDLSWDAVLYTLPLALVAAAIVGIVPALKATGRRVRSGLQGLSPGGGARMRLGRTWTVLIVAQVAFAVALVPGAVYHAWDSLLAGTADPGFAAEEFLTASLVLDRVSGQRVAPGGAEPAGFTSRLADRHAELMRRLRAEPGISDVTFAAHVPGEESTVWVEAEGVPLPPDSQAEMSGFAVHSGRFGLEARFNRVDVDFFEAFDVPILTGRALTAADVGPTASVVIVNRSLARRIAGEGNILGRRVRYVGISGDARADLVELERWYEIVGVVPDFPEKATSSGLVDAKLYHAAAAGQIHPVGLTLRVRGAAPATVAGRLREIAAAVDPSLQLRSLLSLDEVLRQEQSMLRLVAAGLAALTLSVVLLSAAGIYALMSFTVAQRRKEIGIRAALGADPRRILASIFSRALAQLAIGALLGIVAATLLDNMTGGDLMEGNQGVVLPIVAAFMTAVGLLAAAGPARRGLRIQPTEALRAE